MWQDIWTGKDDEAVKNFLNKKAFRGNNLESMMKTLYRIWENRVLSSIAVWQGESIHIKTSIRSDFIVDQAVNMLKSLGPKGRVHHNGIINGYVPRAKDFEVKRPGIAHKPEHKIRKVYRKR